MMLVDDSTSGAKKMSPICAAISARPPLQDAWAGAVAKLPAANIRMANARTKRLAARCFLVASTISMDRRTLPPLVNHVCCCIAVLSFVFWSMPSPHGRHGALFAPKIEICDRTLMLLGSTTTHENRIYKASLEGRLGDRTSRLLARHPLTQ